MLSRTLLALGLVCLVAGCTAPAERDRSAVATARLSAPGPWSEIVPTPPGRFDDLAADRAGNVWGRSSTGAVVTKLDAGGGLVWTRRVLTSSPRGYFEGHLAVDPAGSGAVVIGSFFGDIDFGDGPIAVPWVGLFALRLDADGNALWSRTWAPSAWGYGGGAAFDDAGNVVIAGGFAGRVDFGGGPVDSITVDCPHDGDEDLGDIFLLKLDANGDTAWQRTFGNTVRPDCRFFTVSQQVGKIAVDSGGAIVLQGTLYGGLDFGGGEIVGGTRCEECGDQSFVAKLSGDGGHMWSHSLAFYDPLFGTQMLATNARDEILVGHWYRDFRGQLRTMVALLDAAGRTRSIKTRLPLETRIALDDDGASHLFGTLRETFDFGGGPLSSTTSGDAFLAKYDASGAHVTSSLLERDASGGSTGVAIAHAPTGMLVTGSFSSAFIDLGSGRLAGPGSYVGLVRP